MGSNLNFKNFGNEPPGGGGGGNRTSASIPLTRQPSVYSLTFDEFQSSLGKDFGSMNMEELLKNIWSAEETQTMASTSAVGGGLGGGRGVGQEVGGLQRQGSLTLPRTLSQKTVDQVWKDISKIYGGEKDVNSGGGGSEMPQRQQTLGEVTLEEFLVRAGVVREETQLADKDSEGGYLGDLSHSAVSNLIGNISPDTANQLQIQCTMPLNVNGVRSSNQQPQQQQQQQQQPIFPKQPGFGYGTQIHLQSGQLSSAGFRGGTVSIGDQCLGSNSGLVQSGAAMAGGDGLGLAGGLGGGRMGAGTGSPVTPLSSDGMGKSNGDTSSVSPSPYMFGGGFRGRKSSSTVEKVVERRQRRMIKNRESAARSRARKQAYTMDLEAEVAKLKEENQELRRKHAELMEMQKNQAMEMMNNREGSPKKRLRRTQTGPW